MRLMRIGAPGRERPVAATLDGRCFDLSPLTPDIDPGFLAADGIARTAAALAAGALPATRVEGERVGPPIARPGALLCIGQNYAAHAAESGSAPPAEPILFHKGTNTVVGPEDDVLIPPGSRKTDWEVELAVVINTGTPEGVALSGRFPYLADGDVVELEIEGLGRQRTRCAAARVAAR
ncbi:fumarylacetoacetate hydrolase family protein [Streptomyces shenzhenensis]|uniref:fumarylacetoacetate hydrolase family protein n=1 Tax=Streptomyces shenzhenensis TaxID=943815 RepID=UPI0033E3B4AC